jgi:magnesium chelatase subunit D
MDNDRLATLWDQACLAVQVVAIDPVGLGGIKLTARAGPVRDVWMKLLAQLPSDPVKLHPNISDEALFGGIDISMIGAQGGALPKRQGVLDRPATLILSMAERCPMDLAGRLALALEQGPGHCLIALEEQVEPDECVPAALSDRLACHIRLDDVPFDTAMHSKVRKYSQSWSGQLPDISIQSAIVPLTVLSARLGIESLRAPLLACRFARAHAVFCGRTEVEQQDLEIAAAVVLAPRARQLPDAPDAPDAPENSSEPPPTDTSEPHVTDAVPQEILTDAVRVALPDGILLTASQIGGGAGVGGGGARKSGNRKGRPLPARKGRPDGRHRIDVLATLRAAVPWQRLRRKPLGSSQSRLALRSQDIHLKRFETCSDRLLVFVVDASGSQALARLGEAKGAVEILLSRAYASRDHAALVSFRGTSSEVLLPPTRSLVQTKKRLAALPGGGGTPLAAGLYAAGSLILQAQRQGLSPLLVMLTDGRANIALDGTAGRARATADALDAARWLHRSKIESVVLDTGIRAQPTLPELARTMGGRLLTLPHAGAARISAGLEQVLRG